MPRQVRDIYKPWKIHIPAALAGRVETILWDPVHNRPSYGKRGALIRRLLEEWIDDLDAGRARIPLDTLEAE